MYSDSNYQRHIRLLSWNLLIESNAQELPVSVTNIARLHEFQDIMDYEETRWDNAKVISAGILDRYGLNHSGHARKELAIRILAPLCVLKACQITTPENLASLADVPHDEAIARLTRLNEHRQRNNDGLFGPEKVICRQFSSFIEKHLDEKRRRF